jgi:hypothetical protein
MHLQGGERENPVVSIAAAVMAHPKRTSTPVFRALMEALAPFGPAVALDRGKGLWDTAQRAWMRPPGGATHVAVFQDDMLPCPGFAEAIAAAVAAAPPEAIVSAFSYQKQAKAAFGMGMRWMVADRPPNACATVMPASVAAKFVRWCRYWIDPAFKHDDGRMGIFCKYHAIPVWITVPSLVEHEDGGLSIHGQFDRSISRKAAVPFSALSGDAAAATVDPAWWRSGAIGPKYALPAVAPHVYGDKWKWRGEPIAEFRRDDR